VKQNFQPINLRNWIKENEHHLRPPICNKLVFQEEEAFIIVIGGANARKEFHYNEAPEFFYQVKGDMLLKIKEQDGIRDVYIREGEVFLLPPRIPHSPIRYDDTVGVVVDMRHPTKKDGLLWFCPQCNNLLYEEYLKVNDIENDFLPVYERFYGSKELLTCNHCNHKMSEN
jgi:3-hydroxyanthranilate 3,4-dioxygenase